MKTRRISIIYALSDFLASAIAWTLFCLIKNRTETLVGSGALVSPDEYITGMIIIPVCWIFLYLLTGFYSVSLQRSRLTELVYSLAVTTPGVFIQFFILLSQGFIKEFSLYIYFLEAIFLFQFTLTYIPRLILTSITARKVHLGLIGYKTVIIGSNGKAQDVYNRITKEKIPGGNTLVGYITLKEGVSGLMQSYLPNLGPIEKLPEIIARNKIEEVIIAIEGNEHHTIDTMIDLLGYSDVTIKAIPSLHDILIGRVRQTAIFGTPLIKISNGLMSVWQANVKRIMDYSLAILLLIICSPLILIMVFFIRLSGKGPVIYSQERIGKNGKPFIIYKFRSMHVDAEQNEPLLSEKLDKRVTGVGRFMRKHRLDELPNLINVIRGEMSLVGPRPERQFFIDQIIKKAPQFKRLHKIKPGITSWGQVKYGYASDVDAMIERLEYDLLYLENMSLTIDLKIIIYTLLIIIQGKGV